MSIASSESFVDRVADSEIYGSVANVPSVSVRSVVTCGKDGLEVAVLSRCCC
jgi:hypothetical protein